MDPTNSIQWTQTQESTLVPVALTTVNGEKYIIYGQPLSQLSQQQQDILDPPPPVMMALSNFPVVDEPLPPQNTESQASKSAKKKVKKA